MLPFLLVGGFSFLPTALAEGASQPPAPENAVNNLTRNGFLTMDQAARLGIKPGKPGRNGTVPGIKAESGGVHADSASGCNQSVCIQVYGSGLHVDEWDTDGYSSEPICTFAAYWVNGDIEATSDWICGGTFTTYYSWWVDPGWFIQNTQLCNDWISISGRPCVTVRS